MTKAEVEPFFGSAVIVTVAIANLDEAQYVGKIHPFSGNSTPRHWAPPPGSAKSETRIVLAPLDSVPDAYKTTATNGLALCPLSAITAISKLN